MIKYTKFEIAVMSIYVFLAVTKATFKLGLGLFLPLLFFTLIGVESYNGYEAVEFAFYGAFGFAFFVVALVNLLKIDEQKKALASVVIADRKIQEREKLREQDELEELENGEEK